VGKGGPVLGCQAGLIRAISFDVPYPRSTLNPNQCKRNPTRDLPFSASASLHHSLSSADFITNIAESSFRHTHPIDSSIDTHQIQGMRRSSVRQERCAHTTKTERRCYAPGLLKPRWSLRHRSGCGVAARLRRQHRERPIGPHQWGMARLGPSRWMLLSPSSKNSILYRAANSVGSSSRLYSLFTSVPTPLYLDASFLTNRPDIVLTTHALGVGGLRD